MMIAYTLWRKDYTNSLYVVRLGPRHSAGFSLREKKKRRTTGNRREKRETNRRRMRGNKATRRAGAAAGIPRQADRIRTMKWGRDNHAW